MAKQSKPTGSRKPKGVPSPFVLHRLGGWNFEPPFTVADLRPFCEFGHAAAIFDAWFLSIEGQTSPPEWLMRSTMKYIEKQIRKEVAVTTLPRGGSNFQRATRDFYKWRTVAKFVAEGQTVEAAAISAAEALKDTLFDAGDDSMTSIYYQVQRHLKKPETAVRYYTAMKHTRVITDTFLDKIPEARLPPK
jgi:hypothetical protein